MIRQRAYEAAIHEQAQAQAEYDLLKAGAWKPDVEIAKAAVSEARAQVEQVKTEIARATVVSPVDGVVLQVNVRAGERVSDRDAKALVVLGDISTYHVRVDIDERDIARFRRRCAGQGLPAGRDGSRNDDAIRAGRAVCRAQDRRSPERTRSGSTRACSRCFMRSNGPNIRSMSASSWMCSSIEDNAVDDTRRLAEGK